MRKEPTLAIDAELFSQRLHIEMKLKGFTYRSLAERASSYLGNGDRVSDVSIWNYVKRRNRPRRLAHVAALARALDLATDDLLGARLCAAEPGAHGGGDSIGARDDPRSGISVTLAETEGEAVRVLVDVRVCKTKVCDAISALTRVSVPFLVEAIGDGDEVPDGDRVATAPESRDALKLRAV